MLKATALSSTLMLLLLSISVRGQKADIHATFTGILDNRELGNSHSISQTIFGGRTDATFGYRLDHKNQLRIGAGYFQEFGASAKNNPAHLLMYYNYEGRNSSFFMGSFPRNATISYPTSLFSDSLTYYRPHVHGGYFRAFNRFIIQDIWIDWVSRQTDEDPEHFLFGASGSIHYGGFFLNHHFKMYHMVGPRQRLPGESIHDNGGIFLSTGYRKNGHKPFDTLEFQSGYLLTLNRVRSLEQWDTPGGLVVKGKVYAFNLGIDVMAFKGNSQKVLLGDPLYRADSYGRIDLSYGRTTSNGAVTYRYFQAFHLIENRVDLSHIFYLTVNISSTLWEKKD